MPSMDSPAKLNLFLEVTGRRPDGFHDIESVFLEIDLVDTLSAEPQADGPVSLECEDPAVPGGADNLVVRAAELLRRECGVPESIRFALEKRIPMGGGLGGGSSNAAAALRLANQLWKTGLSDEALAGLGARIGSDVPFFLYGGTCQCRGRGEVVSRLPDFPADTALGLMLSGIHSDTAAGYGGLRLPDAGGRKNADAFVAAMHAADAEGMAATAFNRFEETVFASLEDLGRLHGALERVLARPVHMSGSGSGLWFFAAPGDEALLEAAPDLGEWRKKGVRHLVVHSRRAVDAEGTR